MDVDAATVAFLDIISLNTSFPVNREPLAETFGAGVLPRSLIEWIWDQVSTLSVIAMENDMTAPTPGPNIDAIDKKVADVAKEVESKYSPPSSNQIGSAPLTPPWESPLASEGENSESDWDMVDQDEMDDDNHFEFTLVAKGP